MAEKLLDKFKYILGVDDEMEDDEEDVVYEEPKRAPRNESRAYDQYQQQQYQRAEAREDKRMDASKQRIKMKLIVNEPVAFEDCSNIVDNLKNKKPVIINLDKVELEMGKRIFDFVSGATYALDGSVQKVANNIFVFAPDNVDIASDIQDYKTFTSADLFR